MYVEKPCRSKTTCQDDSEELVKEADVLQEVVLEQRALIQEVQDGEGE